MALNRNKYGAQFGATGKAICDFVDKWYPKSGELYVTSAYRAREADGGTWSHHNGQVYQGSDTAAVDFGAWDFGQAEGSRRMRDLAKWLFVNFGDLTVEMFHTTPYSDDNGFNIRAQRPTGGIAAHGDHIHYATSAALLAKMEARAQQKWGKPGPPPPQPAAQSNVPVNSLGLDFAWSKPNLAAIKGFGARFVMRYLSWLPNGKVLTRSEVDGYLRAGLAVGLNWEWDTDDQTKGAAGGTKDATEAVRQARALGAPAGQGIAIYFSADSEDTSRNPRLNYWLAAQKVVEKAGYKMGIYGGYYAVDAALKMGYKSWQTQGWSDGKWHPRMHIKQFYPPITVGGADVDKNQIFRPAEAGLWGYKSGTVQKGIPDMYFITLEEGTPPYRMFQSNGVKQRPVPDVYSKLVVPLQKAGVPTFTAKNMAEVVALGGRVEVSVDKPNATGGR